MNNSSPQAIATSAVTTALSAMSDVIELSEIFEPNRMESNRNQSNRIEFRVRIKFESFTVLILFILNDQMVN